MRRLDFFIVDVFAQEKYAGNQLAVFSDAAALANLERIQRLLALSTRICADDKERVSSPRSVDNQTSLIRLSCS